METDRGDADGCEVELQVVRMTGALEGCLTEREDHRPSLETASTLEYTPAVTKFDAARFHGKIDATANVPAVAMLMKLALTTLAVSHTLVRNVAVIKPMMRIDEFGQYDEHRDVWLQRLADAHARANAKRAELEAKTRQEAGEERTTLAMRVSPMVETTADEIAMLRRAHELTRNLRQNLNQLQEAEHGLAVRGLLTSGQNKFRSLLRLVLSGLSDRSETQRRAILIRPEVRSGFDEHRRYKLDQEYTH